MSTCTQSDIDTARKHRDVTPYGVAFDWSLVSANGARFTLLREPHHTDLEIEASKEHLLRDRDVVGEVQVAILTT